MVCRHGGIGRRKGLKIPRGQPRTGSSPVAGIKDSVKGTLSQLAAGGSSFLFSPGGIPVTAFVLVTLQLLGLK